MSFHKAINNSTEDTQIKTSLSQTAKKPHPEVKPIASKGQQTRSIQAGERKNQQKTKQKVT